MAALPRYRELDRDAGTIARRCDLATATSRCSLGVDSNLEPVRVTPLRSDVLPSEELAGNAAPIVGAYAVIP